MQSCWTFRLSIVIFCIGICITACTPTPQSKPTITFLGVATGSLVSDLNTLQFTDRFSANDGEIIGVIGLKEPADGSLAVATWFTPDDRNMPVGRTSLTFASGATVGRFSFASDEKWNASPYMLSVRIYEKDENGSSKEVFKNSIQFFVDMTDEDISVYMEEYNAWKQEQEEGSSSSI